mgnify:CR=1 FL=1
MVTTSTWSDPEYCTFGKVEAIHIVPQDPVCVVPLLESEEVHAGRGAVRMFSHRLTRQANVEDDGGDASHVSSLSVGHDQVRVLAQPVLEALGCQGHVLHALAI